MKAALFLILVGVAISSGKYNLILFRGVSGYPKLDGAFYSAKTCPLATYAPVISKTQLLISRV